MHNKRLLILVAILAGASIVLAGLQFCKIYKSNGLENFSTSLPTSSVSADETQNWKTYRNDKLGFEFKYPEEEYVLDEKEEKQGYYDLQVTKIASVSAKEKYIHNSSFTVLADNTVSNLHCMAKDGLQGKEPLTETKEINGNTFFIFVEKQGDSAMGGARGLSSEYRITKNGYCFILASSLYWTQVGYAGYVNNGKNDATPEEVKSQNDAIKKHEEITEKILSTFKFTDASASQNQIVVDGMQKYTDSDFGFTFWYPSTWTVQNSAIRNSYVGGNIQKSLTIGPTGAAGADTITIDEYHSPTREITIARDLCSPMSGSSVAQHRFYFNTDLHTWMVEVPAYNTQSERDGSTYNVPASIKPADVSQDTMGGLHMLGAGCSGFVIPLTAQNFLVYTYYSRNVGSAYGNIAKTIKATDPSVATPVSTSEQIQIITNAGVLLDAIGKKVGEWHVTNEHVYNYLGNLVAYANPSTFQLISKYSDDSLGVSYATDGARIFSGWLYGQLVDGADPATFVAIRQQYQIPYAQSSGRYGESFASYDVSFSKDKSHVWYQSRLIPGADPKTFVVTGDTHVENSKGQYTLAHDRNHTYALDNKDNLTIDGVIMR